MNDPNTYLISGETQCIKRKAVCLAADEWLRGADSPAPTRLGGGHFRHELQRLVVGVRFAFPYAIDRKSAAFFATRSLQQVKQPNLGMWQG